MKLEERLGANKYYVDETSPHIIVDGAGFSLEEKMKLVNGCPAGLYTLQENGRRVIIFLVIQSVLASKIRDPAFC